MIWLKKWLQRRREIRNFRRGLERLVRNMRKDGHSWDDCIEVCAYIGGIRTEIPKCMLPESDHAPVEKGGEGEDIRQDSDRS
jgi:hypothetical protein